MKTCSHCGIVNIDSAQICQECRASFSIQPSKTSLWSRRVLSATLSILTVALVGPELSYLHESEMLFWIGVPLLAVAFVWFGAGRLPLLEGAGWFIYLGLISLLFG